MQLAAHVVIQICKTRGGCGWLCCDGISDLQQASPFPVKQYSSSLGREASDSPGVCGAPRGSWLSAPAAPVGGPPQKPAASSGLPQQDPSKALM